VSLPEAPITRRVKVTVSSVLTSAQELKLYAGSGVTFTATEALGVVSLTISASGGGGGTLNHAALTSNLAWGTSGHTGTASKVAGFDGAGAATYYGIGSDLQAYDADLAAIAALSATAGMLSRTGAGAFAARTLQAPAAGLGITNPTGAAGDPTFALADDLAALEGLSGTGYAKRTGTSTWSVSSTVPWSDVASTPTTLAGYGITTPIAIGSGGTGQTTAAAAFDALAPTTTAEDLIIRRGGTNTRLAAGASEGMTLQMRSGVVTWAAPVVVGLLARGDVFVEGRTLTDVPSCTSTDKP